MNFIPISKQYAPVKNSKRKKEDRTKGSGWDPSTAGQLTRSPSGTVTESHATIIYRAGTGC